MSVVVFFDEIVEREYRPTERGKPDFEAYYGANGGLMIRMTNPIFRTRKYVLMDGGFCVLKGLICMLEHGVYGMMAIKKKNCPKECKGYSIEAFFRDKEVGDIYAVF